MPKTSRGSEPATRIQHPELLNDLIQELRETRESGQPLIDEQHFPDTGAVRVTVMWDKWEGVPFEERVAIIEEAYQVADGIGRSARPALVMGFTFPEAYEAGQLPFQVVPVLRKDDRVTLQQCEKAMLADGASLLFVAERPQLRFPTRDDAESCVRRLVKRLPQSDQVWAITEEVGHLQPRIFG